MFPSDPSCYLSVSNAQLINSRYQDIKKTNHTSHYMLFGQERTLTEPDQHTPSPCGYPDQRRRTIEASMSPPPSRASCIRRRRRPVLPSLQECTSGVVGSDGALGSANLRGTQSPCRRLGPPASRFRS